MLISNVTYAVSIDGPYLQHRTYDSGEETWRGWISVTVDGEPIQQDNVSTIELTDESGNEISIANTRFWPAPSYYWGSWNTDQNKVEYSGPHSYAGYIVEFNDTQTFESVKYTYRIETEQGETASKEIFLPDKDILPTVNKDDINYSWSDDNSLNINWTHPSSSDFDVYYLYFMDGDSYNDLLYVRLPNTKTSITIPSSVINDILNLYNSSSLHLQLQTRKYYSNHNYARGITRLDIPAPENEDNGNGGGGGGCLMNPKASFGFSWLLLLMIPAFMFVRRRL